MQRLDASLISRASGAFELHDRETPARLALTGRWISRTAGRLERELAALNLSATKDLVIDLSAVELFDTAGAWLVHRMTETAARSGATWRIVNAGTPEQILLDAVAEASREAELEVAGAQRRWDMAAPLVSLGRVTYAFLRDFRMSMHLLGATVRGAQMKLGHSQFLSITPIIHQIDRMGVGAIPVVLLMSTIIGAIIAQQGAFQLRYFGAEIFVVDLVAILVLREIGVLLTAIMIAGRSGSAITAEIGSMKMREEIDALTVIGLNPIGVLVFPRLVALVIGLPLLTIVSNFAALGGAMAVADIYSGITPDAFIQRMREAIDLTTIFAGLIKAPFMAMIIGIIASVEGLKVGGSAESLGRRVTASVVKSIFVVIVVDGLFAMFYAAIDF
ncbi:MAG: MlaE family lipid ABC transporter permease subunit [Brucellaceae bacterium]|nr:MlaE family lipid ABC transporter permease subunit [Brucellaceae bacterium]